MVAKSGRLFLFLTFLQLGNLPPQTAYKARFGEDFRGPILPFGCAIKYDPRNKEEKRRLHGMAEKKLEGIFVGYEQQAGGGWTDKLLIADIDEIREAKTVSSVNIKTDTS